MLLHIRYATHAGIRTRGRSTILSRTTSPLPRRSPTNPPVRTNSAASVLDLSPGELSARNHSTSELLRTLSRMAASKPTSWLSGQHDHLFHYSVSLGTLAAGLGCFPLDD